MKKRRVLPFTSHIAIERGVVLNFLSHLSDFDYDGSKNRFDDDDVEEIGSNYIPVLNMRIEETGMAITKKALSVIRTLSPDALRVLFKGDGRRDVFWTEKRFSTAIQELVDKGLAVPVVDIKKGLTFGSEA